MTDVGEAGTDGTGAVGPSGARTACVFGAHGGIGAALVAALAAREDVALVHAGARVAPPDGDKVRGFAFDLTDESSIAAAAEAIGAPSGLRGMDTVIVATGALRLAGADGAEGTGPERSARAIEPGHMARMFAVNAIGPALIAKHMLPLLPRDAPARFAALSARVGSIGDNRLGGWHSYRASKAALNMLLRNFAIETARTHPQAILAALHPGTVDTPLSRPFQRGLPKGQLRTPAETAEALLAVLDRLTPADSGGFFAWDGEAIPF